MAEMMVTTTETIPGQKYTIIGEVFGLTTQSKNVVRDIGASLKKTSLVARLRRTLRC